MQIEASWKLALQQEFEKSYFKKIGIFLEEEKKINKIIFPAEKSIFKAFNLTPIKELKVVLLGQDPYHNPAQAMGLSFSVPPNTPIPPSLKNIYKELENDLKIPPPISGDITNWALQGVLLLNSILTVRKNDPGSHRNIGWQQFTDGVISYISKNCNGIVFLLWGKFAQQKIGLIDSQKHLILTAAHPSPYSANNGFMGCRHFSKTNNYLIKQNKSPINWQI